MSTATKVDIPPPPKSTRGGQPKPSAPATKQDVPGEAEASDNLVREPSANLVNLAFRIDPELKREIKMYAADHDISMKELLGLMFAEYRDRHRTRESNAA